MAVKKTASAKAKAPKANDYASPPPTIDERPREDAIDEDDAIRFLRRMILWQMTEIESRPSQTAAEANRRARDSKTMSELVHSLERLDALRKKRERTGSGKSKAKSSSDDIKADLVRRLDKLLAVRSEDGGAAKPERR